jgi:hypothetical protein
MDRIMNGVLSTTSVVWRQVNTFGSLRDSADPIFWDLGFGWQHNDPCWLVTAGLVGRGIGQSGRLRCSVTTGSFDTVLLK